MPECKKCKGTGTLNDSAPWVVCPECDGWGRVDYTDDEIKKIDEDIAAVEATIAGEDEDN